MIRNNERRVSVMMSDVVIEIILPFCFSSTLEEEELNAAGMVIQTDEKYLNIVKWQFCRQKLS